MSLINIKIEGIPYQVESGITILEAARQCGYDIPSLCTFNHGQCSQGSCRVCLVEATGARGLVASCVYPVAEGMEIRISSPKAVKARRIVSSALRTATANFSTLQSSQEQERMHLQVQKHLQHTMRLLRQL